MINKYINFQIVLLEINKPIDDQQVHKFSDSIIRNK
jgi:hypothetical protein